MSMDKSGSFKHFAEICLSCFQSPGLSSTFLHGTASHQHYSCLSLPLIFPYSSFASCSPFGSIQLLKVKLIPVPKENKPQFTSEFGSLITEKYRKNMQKFCFSPYQAETLGAYGVIFHHCQALRCLHPFLTTHKGCFQRNQA